MNAFRKPPLYPAELRPQQVENSAFATEPGLFSVRTTPETTPAHPPQMIRERFYLKPPHQQTAPAGESSRCSRTRTGAAADGQWYSQACSEGRCRRALGAAKGKVSVLEQEVRHLEKLIFVDRRRRGLAAGESYNTSHLQELARHGIACGNGIMMPPFLVWVSSLMIERRGAVCESGCG